MKIAIVGAGWAGLAAAVAATRADHQVTVFEAARTLGGRARALPAKLRDGTPVTLDNGQHILIGAYRDTLALMRAVGLEPDAVLQRLPLSLVYPDGTGLRVPPGRAPFNLLAGVLRVQGWTWRDKLSLLHTSLRWRLNGFQCAAKLSVAELGHTLSPRVMTTLVEPLCVSALNTPAAEASAQVFLRVLQDSLFGGPGGADLLLPRTDLGALLPDAAAAWLAQRGAKVVVGQRVTSLQASTGGAGRWTAAHLTAWYSPAQHTKQCGFWPVPLPPGEPLPRRCVTRRSPPSTPTAPPRAFQHRCWPCPAGQTPPRSLCLTGAS